MPDHEQPEPICDTCRHVGNTSGNPWYWHCLKIPRLPRYSSVTGKTEPDPPHYFCKELNGFGQCRFYEPNPAGSATAKRRTTDENQ